MRRARAIVWVVKDRWGRDITLYQDTWSDHIVKRHADLRHREAAVARTLERPFRVMHDAFEESRECFYAQILPTFPGNLVKVCVEFRTEREGIVVSAFLTSGIPPREVQKWP
jgi:hypothetical protein